MAARLRVGTAADVGRVLREKTFRADHPFRTSRLVLGASTLDLEGAPHRARKRAWWSTFSRQWTDGDAARAMVEAAVTGGLEAAGTSGDLLRASVYVPNRVVLDLLGLPEADPFEHYAHLQPVLRALGGTSAHDRVALAEAKDYVGELAHDVTAPLFDGLEGDARSTELALFLVAGAETTVVALEVLTRAWWNDAEALREDVHRCGPDGAVMRVLAEDAPLGSTTRFAAEEIVVDEVGRVPRGAIVDVDLVEACSAAGRGEDVESRRAAQGYVFGAGAHRCPGDRLAMLEARVFVEALLALDPGDYEPVLADGPRAETFRHVPWQSLTARTDSRVKATT